MTDKTSVSVKGIIVSLLVDTNNIFQAVRRKFGDGRRIDYDKYFESVQTLFGVQDKIICYVSKVDSNAIKFIDALRARDVQVRVKEPRKISETIRQINWSVEICCDAFELANQSKPLIIGSNDPVLLPLLKTIRPLTGVLHVYAVGVPKQFTFHASIREVEESCLQSVRSE